MKKQPSPNRKPPNYDTRKRRPNSADVQVGESIRAHRLLAGMSQGDLARQIGVTFQQVQKYEKGTNRIGAGHLPQIAEMLGVPVAALFKEPVGTGPVSVTLVTNAAAARMLTAYADIKDSSVRRNLSVLVDRIAKSRRKSLGDNLQ